MIAFVLAATLCGASVSIPKEWRAEVDDTRKQRDGVCEIILTPPRWDDVHESSAWGRHDSPAIIFVFESPSMDDAMPEVGFERDEDGKWFLASFRGYQVHPSRFRVGAWRGVKAEGMYRGWAKDKSKLEAGESSIYSAATPSVLLKKGRRVVGMMCDTSGPAYPVDCDALIERVFQSMK